MDYNVTFRNKDKGLQCIISYKLGDTWKQKSKQGFKTQKSAKNWIDESVKLLEKKVANYTAGYTFKMLVDKYKEDFVNSRAAFTMDNLDIAYKKFDMITNMALEDISQEIIQKCVNDMIGLEKTTIKGYLTIIKRLFNTAIKKYKLIKDNPVHDIEIPEKDTPRRERISLTKKELDSVLSNTTSLKYKTFISLASHAGLRCGEILGLTKSDIDDNYIYVNKQWKKLKDGTYGFGILKNKDKGKRKVPISPELKKLLDEYILECKFDRLFPYSTSPSGAGAIRRYIKELGYDFTLHELRHTFATTMLANGLDVKTVAYLIGDTVETVMKTYIHFTPDMMTKAENIIKSVF